MRPNNQIRRPKWPTTSLWWPIISMMIGDIFLTFVGGLKCDTIFLSVLYPNISYSHVHTYIIPIHTNSTNIFKQMQLIGFRDLRRAWFGTGFCTVIHCQHYCYVEFQVKIYRFHFLLFHSISC